jgi:replicative DNA helicase Mcm
MASGGIAAIDEFEKMDTRVRTTLNEPMESGRISIAKAGIVTDMPAECSVLVAANPVMGRFDDTEPYIDQCNIEPSLRTRFDLIFSLQDIPDEKRDAEICSHVLDNHIIGGSVGESIDPELLKKYVAFARRLKPDISGVKSSLSEVYLAVRCDEHYRGVTVRMLESLVRLCEASARMRLSEVVSDDDVEYVSKIVQESLRSSCTDANGTADLNILEVGIGQGQQERFRKWKAVLLEYKAGLTRDDLKAKLEASGYKLKFFEADLKKYRAIGEVHEPREGIISLA